MSIFAKIYGQWKTAAAIYMKNNGVWMPITDVEFNSYLSGRILEYGYHTQSLPAHTLMISGPSSPLGTSAGYVAVYDGNAVNSNVTWAIVSGASYASISQTGELTILSPADSGTVVISATYAGMTAEKTLLVTYEAGTTSEIETKTSTETNDSGQTITTTTTTTVITDASGNTAVTESVTQIIENQDGSMSSVEQETNTSADGTVTEQTTTINYDENGDVTGSQESEIVTNPDGSFGGSTTNYNENGKPTDTTNQSGDTAGNVDTQQVEYDESGTPVVTGYEIDTTGSNGEGKEIDGDGVNTEFVPFKFASEGFVINFDFESTAAAQPRPPITEDTEDSGTNYLYTVLGAKTTAKVGNIWPGFEIRWTIPKSGSPNFSDDTKCPIQFNRTFSGETSTTRTNFTSGYSPSNVYYLTVIYDPAESTKFKVRNNVINANIQTGNKALQDNVDLDLTIGYSTDHNGDKIRHSSLIVHDFSVVKLNTAATITQPVVSCSNNEVSMSCATAGAKIYYKLSTEDKYDLYESPITITANTTFNAYAIYQHKVSSVITTACNYVDNAPAAPVINFDGENVTITCTTQGATIYYKLGDDGIYNTYSSPIAISEDTTVYAYSQKDGISSETVNRHCVIITEVASPVISCDGEYVTITCEMPDAIIYYRTGTTGNFNEYSGVFAITADTTVQAYSEFSSISSTTVTENCIYHVNLVAPVITCDGEYVTITCSTAGAAINYRIGTSGNFDAYSAPFAITADTTVQAYSTLNGESSATVTQSCIYNATHDYSQDYLTLNALSDGTILWKCIGSTASAKTISYSVDDGQTWSAITSTAAGVPISVTAGQKVLLKGTNPAYSKDKSNYSGFEGGTAMYDIEGNIMSLIYGDNFIGNTGLTTTFTFCSIFKKSNAVSAENLILPATTLTNAAYRAMFSYAESLTTPPAVLPATTLNTDCYWYMFEKCPITTAPLLPAATLVKGCYGYMFTGCNNLNHIECLATNISASACTVNWVSNVAATGTFVKDANMTSWTTGISGIPTGWIVSDSGAIIVAEPEISCDGEEVTITCDTTGADIYYRLNEAGNYSAYTTAVAISADTIVQAYATLNGESSTTVTQSCEYLSSVPLEYSNRALGTWNYNSQTVDTPYSVNAIDGHSSSMQKGTFNFETSFVLREAQPAYLWFQHADQSAAVYVDNTLVEKHWGGYNAFTVDISNNVHSGTNNIKVALKNNEGSALAPCDGDFNFNATLGNVKLLTSPVLPAINYGYDGFHVTSNVTTGSATVNVETTVPSGATLLCIIDDGNFYYSATTVSDGSATTFTTIISNPVLWHGTTNPHLYTITLEISKDGNLYHRFQRDYGLRFFDYAISGTTYKGGETGVTYQGSDYTGFLLNGQPYFLRGVCMHDDLKNKANALNDADYVQEFAIVQELGCNFIRLAHYPHTKEVYDWCDRLGIIVQTEVPWVKNASTGQPQTYWDHLDGQFRDMVNQHYNHPSIIFWGLSNETTTTGTTEGKNFIKDKIEGYTATIKSLDPNRWVGYVMSHSWDDPLGYYNNPDVDWVGCNLYVGWYINKTSNDPTAQLNTRITKTVTNKHKPVALSEYGCGGTQHCHSESAQTTTTKGNYERHDIEYQMWLHEGHIAAIRSFPQLLFTGQWQLFDIAVTGRNEGYIVCLDGETTSTDDSLRRLNNKGLVERDHVTKKDTFYLYKAEWNPTPFMHICGKDYLRLLDREIKCYTNDGSSATLYVGNAAIETVSVTDHIAVFTRRDFTSGDTVTVSGATTSDTFQIGQ